MPSWFVRARSWVVVQRGSGDLDGAEGLDGRRRGGWVGEWGFWFLGGGRRWVIRREGRAVQ